MRKGIGGGDSSGSLDGKRSSSKGRPLPNPGKSSSESMNIPPPVFHSEDDDNDSQQDQRGIRFRQYKSGDERRGSLESLQPSVAAESLESQIKTILSRDDEHSLQLLFDATTLPVLYDLMSDRERNVALIAAKMGACKCLDWILANVPKEMEKFLSLQDPNGQTILHHLAMNYAKGGGKLLHKLFHTRSEILTSAVNQKNNFGWTCLMLAAYDGNGELCDLLLKAGANVQAKNNTGWTASDIASDQKHFSVVNLLAPFIFKAQARDSFSQEKIEIEMDSLQETRALQPTAAVNGFYTQTSAGALQRQVSRRRTPQQNAMTNLPRSVSYRDRQNRMRLREERFGDGGPAQSVQKKDEDEPSITAWRVFSWIVTFLFPPQLLSAMGLKSKEVQQAWREKIALCFIIALCSGILAFLSFGLSQLICRPLDPKGKPVYPWTEIIGNQNYYIYNGKIYDVGKIRNSTLGSQYRGRDVSHYAARDSKVAGYFEGVDPAGLIDSTDTGCFISNTIVIISVLTLFAIIFTKFASAVAFNWILSNQLGKISRTRLPQSHVVLLVTCYSESEESLRTTLDSLSATDYSNEQKILFIVADGNVTGSGNAMSTPELCKKIMLIEDWSNDPVPMAYDAIGDGPKKINASCSEELFIADLILLTHSLTNQPTLFSSLPRSMRVSMNMPATRYQRF